MGWRKVWQTQVFQASPEGQGSCQLPPQESCEELMGLSDAGHPPRQSAAMRGAPEEGPRVYGQRPCGRVSLQGRESKCHLESGEQDRPQ